MCWSLSFARKTFKILKVSVVVKKCTRCISESYLRICWNPAPICVSEHTNTNIQMSDVIPTNWQWKPSFQVTRQISFQQNSHRSFPGTDAVWKTIPHYHCAQLTDASHLKVTVPASSTVNCSNLSSASSAWHSLILTSTRSNSAIKKSQRTHSADARRESGGNCNF